MGGRQTLRRVTLRKPTGLYYCSQNLHKKTLAFLSLWCYITYRTKEMTRQVSFLTKPLVEGC